MVIDVHVTVLHVHKTIAALTDVSLALLCSTVP
jgi:hypothetical protein